MNLTESDKMTSYFNVLSPNVIVEILHRDRAYKRSCNENKGMKFQCFITEMIFVMTFRYYSEASYIYRHTDKGSKEFRAIRPLLC